VGKVKGDFGGISYKNGDFHTVGYSGIDVSTGDFITNGTSGLGSSTQLDFISDRVLRGGMSGMGGSVLADAMNTIFGTGGAQAVISAAQTGASSIATNVIGSKLGTDPSAKQGVVDTIKASAAQLYQEYKIPVIVVTVGLSSLLAYGIYNAVKKK